MDTTEAVRQHLGTQRHQRRRRASPPCSQATVPGLLCLLKVDQGQAASEFAWDWPTRP
jgi:hypothetical protein